MRLCAFLILGMLAFGGLAEAQSGAPAVDRGYVEGVAQSAFGNITSQSYGIEGGYPVTEQITVFAEFGRVADVTTAGLSDAAALIAGALSSVQSGSSYSVAEPVSFLAAGAKYLTPPVGRLQPYVLGGFGLATVKKDVVFNVDNVDVTSRLDDYGIVLGSDLSGSTSSAMFVLGAGATLPIRGRLFADLQFRFNRIFADEPISVGRVGLGLGVRF